MFTIVFIILAALAAIGTILVKKKKRAVDIIETILLFILFFCVGIGGLFAFAGHAFMSDQVAEKIGWPAGNPFQLEVAAANLALGILGILSFRFRRDFWLAVSISYAVFLFGAAAIHIHGMLVRGNYSEYNTGAIPYLGDIFTPLLLLVLVLVHRRLER
ncbi:MAG: hypothetical protein E4G96_03065 [Chrysiogenales bacterium]|nr:MAG: hypothetical protein E4G96_03065 [Chrysiogenales bacterium]